MARTLTSDDVTNQDDLMTPSTPNWLTGYTLGCWAEHQRPGL
jgi:hypothetical protein